VFFKSNHGGYLENTYYRRRTALISTASFVQTLAKTPSQSAASVAAAGDWSASKLSGEANDNVGEISDVIIESNGKVRGLVLEASD
jgi:hypothetical protein